MNDITALPTVTPEMLASLKLSAMNLTVGEMMSFEPVVFRALVEALEKAQSNATQQGNIACALFDEVTAQRQRIAELESRTVIVKLAEDRAAESEISGYDGTEFYRSGWNARGKADRDALATAGIQVIEGEQKNG